MITIYFDTCALNRLTDDMSQPRIRAEAEAVEQVLELVETGHVSWSVSAAVRLDLSFNPDRLKRSESLALLDLATTQVLITSGMYERGTDFEAAGFGHFDVLHLAVCELAEVDFLLTVDDRFLGRASRHSDRPPVQVLNPIDWLSRRSSWLLTPKPQK